MSKLIGIDTGGTYTDAVVFSESGGVLAKAKALTTKRDLSQGIGEALDAALCAARVEAGAIDMVSLSTTLATNAIVEGLGEKVGLVLIGFAERDLSRAGLREALGEDLVLFVAGGHDAHGSEKAELDAASILLWLKAEAAGVSAFAVAGQFSVANPAHEIAVRDLLRAETARPVTCSHELSAKLNAPKRALTSLLNARLIGIIHHLLDATDTLLKDRSIGAPVMVVKGDGSLIAAAEARRKPIETILSGPAASIVGASYLSGLGDALVSDIGGTTTDVALLRDGRPRLDERGARVGAWSTMVEAVAISTIGLGGDSDVRQAPGDAELRLALGPRRVVPVSLLATQFGKPVHAALDRQLSLQIAGEETGRFAFASGRGGSGGSADGELEAEMLRAVADRPVPLDQLVTSRRHRMALRRLQTSGGVSISGFCPSDAAHVLGLHDAWDRAAAVKAATLFSRRQTARGRNLADGAEAISRAVVDALVARSAEALLDAAFAEDGDPTPNPSAHPFLQAAMHKRAGLVRLGVALSAPIVALGASARTYYGAVAERLNAEAIVPEHADVANAIGAVVGHVRVTSSVTISEPASNVFRAYFETGPRDFRKLADAVAEAEAWLRADVAAKAEANGARDADVTLSRHENAVTIVDTPLFLEMRIVATAVGRPAAAR